MNPSSQDLDWLDGYTVIGEIQKPHGVRGDAKVKPETFDLARFKKVKQAFIANPKSRKIQEIKIESSRINGETLLVKFDLFSNPEIVKEHRFHLVLIPEEERLPLEEGEYYLADLIGLMAVDQNGKERGTVEDVEEYPANFVFTLTIDSKKVLAPWIDDCLIEIDLDTGKIIFDFDFLGV